jgi:hypothetical protein
MLLILDPCGTAPAAAAAAAAAPAAAASAVVGTDDSSSVVLSALQRSAAAADDTTLAADAPPAAVSNALSACLSNDPAFANGVQFDDQYTFYWNIVGNDLQARVVYTGVGWVGW